ncbi:MAG: hypothetical protein WA705_27715 [Candidatus Ozemobacteraceae bacterium]
MRVFGFDAIICIAFSAFFCLFPLSLTAQSVPQEAPPIPVPEKILSGTWGTKPSQIGIKFLSPDILPETPFCGPGGFAVDASGTVWITDSIQGCIKIFEPLGNKQPGFKKEPRIIPVGAKKLGDIALTANAVFVAGVDPNAIIIFDKATGKEMKRISVPYRSPGRLLAIDEKHIAISETGNGLWLVIDEKSTRYPSEVIEPIGTSQTLYGTVYDFDPTSRRIVQAPWDIQKGEPEPFALYRAPGNARIIFSRILTMRNSFPLLSTVTASSPTILSLTTFDREGHPKPLIDLPLQDGPALPSRWIQGEDGAFYVFSGNLKGFSLERIRIP